MRMGGDAQQEGSSRELTEVSRERFEGIVEVTRKHEEQHPEFLGLVYYGSLSRGESTAESDIDGFVIVDEQALREREGESVTVPRTNNAGEVAGVDLRDDVYEKYARSFRTELQERLGVSEEQVEHVRVLVVSREIIDGSLARLRAQVEEFRRVQERNKKLGEARTSGQEGEREYLDVTPPHPESHLYALFHPGIGTKLQPYRDYVLDQLGGMGEIGEAMWREIVSSTRFFEERSEEQGGDSASPSSSTGRMYPQTITAAKRAYGS